jgi:hypothetical protein
MNNTTVMILRRWLTNADPIFFMLFCMFIRRSSPYSVQKEVPLWHPSIESIVSQAELYFHELKAWRPTRRYVPKSLEGREAGAVSYQAF